MALIATACGSDDESSDTTAAADTTTAVPVTTGAAATTQAPIGSTSAATTEGETATSTDSGEPKTIKILLIAPEDTPSSNLPDAQAGAEAAAEALKAGGSNVTVEIEYCNDKADPNEATTCARKADDSYAAVFTAGRPSQQVFEVVDPLGIPIFGPNLAMPAVGSSNFYSTDGGLLATYAAVGSAVGMEGYKTVVTVSTDLPVVAPLRAALQGGLEANGGKVVGDVLLPPTAITDYAPFVAQVQASGAEVACLVLSTSGITAMSQAMEQAGVEMKRCVPYDSMPLGEQVRAGDLLDGVISGSAVPPILVDSAEGDIAQYLQELTDAGSDPASLAGVFGLRAWAMVHVLADIANQADGTDGAAIKAALDKSGPIEVPALGTWDPSAAGPKQLPRHSNMLGHGFVFEGTTPVEIEASPFDVFDVFNA